MSVPNIKPKTIFTGDNLPIMRGMNSESIDLIYLDPPFNSNANYAAPIGSKAAGAEFKDMWTLDDIDITWLDLIEIDQPALNRVIHATMTTSDKSYLIYMAIRLLEMKRILKPTGSIYLHCDPTMSHSLKLVMDAIFGRTNFRREIIWNLNTASGYKSQVKGFIRGHDVILYYAKNTDVFVFNKIFQAHKPEYIRRFRKIDEDGRHYRDDRPNKTRQYLDQTRGVALTDVWSDIMSFQQNATSAERIGYPTQKPLALLDRIVKASSNEGNLVLDPFCGCATTCVAADRLQRNWIGIDYSPKAAELVVKRIKADQGLFEDIITRTDIPKRTDLGHIPRYSAPENKTQLYGKQAGFCNGCKEHFQLRLLEIDHIIATSVGGTDHIDNLQLLCSHCNRIKGDRGQEYLLTRLNS